MVTADQAEPDSQRLIADDVERRAVDLRQPACERQPRPCLAAGSTGPSNTVRSRSSGIPLPWSMTTTDGPSIINVTDPSPCRRALSIRMSITCPASPFVPTTGGAGAAVITDR